MRNAIRLLDRIKDYEKRVLKHSGALCREDHEALRDALGLMARVITRSRPIGEELWESSGLGGEAGGDLCGRGRASGRASLPPRRLRVPHAPSRCRWRGPRSSGMGAPRADPGADQRRRRGAPLAPQRNNDRLPWGALQCCPHGDATQLCGIHRI